jgi:hypothetical protein
MRKQIGLAIGLAIATAPVPAAAEVAAVNDGGFVSHNVAEVAAPPAEAWARLFVPREWWNGEHTYSGDSANLTIAAAAGGCFCETIPGANGAPAGQIEHMRVVYLDPRVLTLRLDGALGPLQSEAVTGVLTMTVEASGAGSKITWDYVVGGYMRPSMREMAPLVDRVIGEQLSRLAASLGRG